MAAVPDPIPHPPNLTIRQLKSALKAVKDIPGVDERFVAQQVDRLKVYIVGDRIWCDATEFESPTPLSGNHAPRAQNEVKRLAVQQNKLRAWKRVLETVDQNQGASRPSIDLFPI